MARHNEVTSYEAVSNAGAGIHGAASRRQVLTALAALGASALLPGAAGRAQSAPGAASRRIDTHHHYFPPAYLEPLAAWGKRSGFGGLQAPHREWSIARDLDEMDRGGVAMSVLSISTPGIWFGDAEEGRRMARLCNDYAAEMRRDHKGRYGIFANLPLPDVDGALTEIAYALDTLKADGIGLMTSYGDKWPGDPLFAPVFAELNRRRAVVYFHPLAPDCCGTLQPGVPASLLEYPHDTARAVASLLFNGAFARYRDISWIFSHAGGSVPQLAGRIAAGSRNRKDLAAIAPAGIAAELTRLYYDTANSAYAPTMAALLAFVPSSQIVFGSDYPYYTVSENVEGLAGIALTDEQRQAIDHGNAERLLPQLKA
jgi:predicted TIM-barrel fold metal-dependent hydrolase